MTKLRWPTIHAWALYDFATTAFSMNIVSTYFALWAIKDHGATDLQYGLTKSLSMAIVVFLAPLIGAMSDRVGRRRPFLVASTLNFVVAAGAIALTNNVWLGLALYGLGNLGYQLSSVFYNAMLPELAPPEAMGRVSGYGRMLGYVGSLVAVIMGSYFAAGKSFGLLPPAPAGGSAAVFLPTAILVGLSSLPLLFASEPARSAEVVREANAHKLPSWPSLIRDLKTDPRLAGVGAFMIGSFFFFDTINTIRDFMSIYLVKVVGLSETGGTLQSFQIALVLCALVGALCWGFVTDRTSPKRALVGVLTTLAIGFLGLVVLTQPLIVMRVLGPLIGFGFAGVLVATRPLLAQLVPADRQGEFFGLFVLCNDVAAIVGPITWGVVVWALSAYGTVAYQAALASQLFFLLIGLGLVIRVPDPKKAAKAEVEAA